LNLDLFNSSCFSKRKVEVCNFSKVLSIIIFFCNSDMAELRF
jgi:hypothetical protein